MRASPTPSPSSEPPVLGPENLVPLTRRKADLFRKLTSRALRSSSDTRMLKIQQYKRKTRGFRTCSCFGPRIWNSLPQDLRHCSTLSSFKAKLKTFSSHSISILISVPSFCYSQCVCVCVCVSVFVVRFFVFLFFRF